MMRALPHLLDAIPDVNVIMIGSEERGGYGLAAPVGKTWKPSASFRMPSF
ncbi:hypothetical protein BH10PSE6_BH10PSE6_20430 [soil metagenome]